MTTEELTKVLKDLPLAEKRIEVEERKWRWIAVITSPQFEGMDHGDRQHMVWEHILSRMDTSESAQVEFIFTMSPSEQERLDRGESLELAE